MKQDCSSIYLWTPIPVPGKSVFLKGTSLLRCNGVSDEWFQVFGRTEMPSPLSIKLETWRHRDPLKQELFAQQQRVTSQKTWIPSHTTVKNLESCKVHFAVSPNLTTISQYLPLEVCMLNLGLARVVIGSQLCYQVSSILSGIHSQCFGNNKQRSCKLSNCQLLTWTLQWNTYSM